MKILVIEDNKKLGLLIKKGLTSEKMIVENSFDGEEGYYNALEGNFDVIILDLMLPKMDGMEICKNLRESGKDTPILMLTAKSELEDRVDGLNIGADDYLSKPFEFEELIARIRALGRRPAKIKSNIISAKGISLDQLKSTVTYKSEEIQLSKKEFQLLEYLLINKNITMSKDQILENVWEFDSDVLPNTVEVYMGYLRNKIDKKYKINLIETVRGFGYRIKE